MEGSRRDSAVSPFHGFVPVKTQTCHRCRWWSDMSTHTGKRCQMVKIIALSIIAGVILVVQNLLKVIEVAHTVVQEREINTHVRLSLEISNVVHCTQLERGMSAMYVSSKNVDVFLLYRLKEHYKDTDNAIDVLSGWVSKGVQYPDHFESKESYHKRIKGFREFVQQSNVTITEVVKFYSDDNAIMISSIKHIFEKGQAITNWMSLVAYHMLIISKENIGIERALGSTFYARGGFPLEDLLWYKTVNEIGVTYIQRCIEYSDLARHLLDVYYTGSLLADDIERMREIILKNNSREVTTSSGDWFNNITEFLNILKTVQDEMATDIIQVTSTHIDDAECQVILNIAILVSTILLVPFVVFLVHKLTSRMQLFAIELQGKTTDLERERKKTVTLLYQMLPVSVAKKLISNQSVIPENYQSVTIFFSDVVGFTAISSRCSPMQVVDMLNILYVTFDDRLENYDVYKVETIGDGYMVASGLPNRNGDRHVSEIAKLALDLMDTIHNLDVPQVKPEKLRLRIGLNTGPVVAGVVGHRMPRYCVFGDTVNTASRMESTGLPLKIQCSENTYKHLQRYPQYVLEERGQVEIKGKGLLTTYWLLYEQDEHGSGLSLNCFGQHHGHKHLPSYSSHFTSSLL